MSRTLNVVRMQLINRQTYIWVPLLVLGGAFVITLAIYMMLSSAGVTGEKYGGGAQAPLWYFLFVGIQALVLTFPFSQAMSVTRRDFYLGTLLTASLTSLALAATFVVGGLIERATGGWGLNGYFFYMPWVWEAGALAAGVIYFAVAMFFFVIGFWTATIYKRFGNLMLTVVLVGLGIILVGLVWIVTVTQSWLMVWEGILALGALGLAIWGLVAIAAMAASSYLTLRRATP